jgi:uncharacterized protein (DUF58 family)
MSSESPTKSLIPVSFGAGNVVQLLSAAACFLAAFVIPAAFPELAELSSLIRISLLALGTLFLLVAVLTMLFRRWLNVLGQRIGIRSRMLLPREGLVYLGIMLVIAIGALTGGNPDTGNMLLLVFGMMAGPFVFNGWVVVLMLSRVSVLRSHPQTTAAGCWFSVEVTLQNGKRFFSSRLVEVRDVVVGNRVREEPSVTFVRVGPLEERVGCYELCIARRGVYQLGPIRISSRFPLGIGERGHTVPGQSELVVHPAIGRLLPGWKRRERELAESAARANARLGIFDDEFHSIREYRSGDNARAIHWRSSARTGLVMVKEHEQRREADLIVLLDFFLTPEFEESLQEKVISLVATLCVEETRHATSGTYRLVIAGKELQSIEVAGAGRFRDAALRALAVCQPSRKAQLSQMMINASQGPISFNSRYVLLTPRPEAAQLLAEAIAQDSGRSESQLINRLLILRCDETTMNDVFAPADYSGGAPKQEGEAYV